MHNNHKKLLLIFLLLLLLQPFTSTAQPTPPDPGTDTGGGTGGTGGADGTTNAPFDGGLSLLVAGGVAYHLHKRKKEQAKSNNSNER